MKKHFFALALFSASFSAPAAKLGTIETQLNSFKCQNQIKNLTTEWQAKANWKGHIGPDGNIVLKRPSAKFAHWIVLERVDHKDVISLMNPATAIRVELNEKCESSLAVFQHNHFSNPDGYNDHLLMKEMHANKKGIIVMWSPGMGHSYTAIQRLQKVAKEQNLSISYVMDPFADAVTAKSELASKNIKLDGIKKLSSLELFFRDATMHYPSFLVYDDSQIISNNIAGLMTEEEYRNSINKYLSQTK